MESRKRERKKIHKISQKYFQQQTSVRKCGSQFTKFHKKSSHEKMKIELMPDMKKKHKQHDINFNATCINICNRNGHNI